MWQEAECFWLPTITATVTTNLVCLLCFLLSRLSLSLSLSLFFLFSLFLFPQQYINVNTALLHNHLAFVQWIKQRHVSTGCYKETLWTTCWKFWKQTEGGKLKKKAFYSAEYLSVGWIFYNGNVFQLQCCVMKDQTCLCCYHISRTVHQFVSWGSEEAQCQFLVHCGHGTRWINSDKRLCRLKLALTWSRTQTWDNDKSRRVRRVFCPSTRTKGEIWSFRQR